MASELGAEPGEDPAHPVADAVGITILRVVDGIVAQHLRREARSPTMSAADVGQQALLVAHREGSLVGLPHGELARRVSRIVRNLLVDHARSRNRLKRRGRRDEVEFVDIDSAVPGSSPVDIVAQNEALATLEQLNPMHAQVFEMRHFGGCSQQQVADALGINTKTVRAYEDLARAFLRHKLR